MDGYAPNIAERLKQGNPSRRFAFDAKTLSLIACYDDERMEFAPFLSRTLTGEWAQLQHEILANGKRMIDLTPDNYWKEI